ncbi:MAG: molybdopterin molybdotransferase MoeA [Alphaproteobacteria bacterium]|nr:molybdopterin molybdotransferase MoeA [Alphaproteobacteria bacterium]
MAQLTDDCFAFGGDLMRTDGALALLARTVTCVTEAEPVPLSNGAGRILAEDVVSPHDIPPYDNAAVDGYAVFFDDLDPSGETVLPVVGRATAGHPLDSPVQRATAVRVFTGARMPEGPDTVMMQEDCRIESDDGTDRVILRPGLKRGANWRRRGEDVTAGSIVLARGQRLRPQDIGQAAAVGRREVLVSRPLRIALFSTGDELRQPGEVLPDGCIYDSNRYILMALLGGFGCRVDDLGIVADRADAVRDALAGAAPGHDLIVTSGGVSVGEEDHVKTAVEALGRLHFWRLAIRPGRPLALGQIGHIPFIGLPGNPVAVMVTAMTILRPMIVRLMGGSGLTPHRFRVAADFAYDKKKNRREWLRARLVDGGEAGWRAVKFPRDGAGILSSMVEADGLIELPEDLTRLEPGTMVDFLPFSELST